MSNSVHVVTSHNQNRITAWMLLSDSVSLNGKVDPINRDQGFDLPAIYSEIPFTRDRSRLTNGHSAPWHQGSSQRKPNEVDVRSTKACNSSTKHDQYELKHGHQSLDRDGRWVARMDASATNLRHCALSWVKGKLWGASSCIDQLHVTPLDKLKIESYTVVRQNNKIDD